ncbi:disulfide with oxidoreductase activity [Lecanosticta acicola]|uniref:Disulfide with oxidoreductase activity n=1 Tax=Lecanosticta acicola TaxID=111012 RepID=A0AAI9E9L4_9PEZI|nr:disulfide with oxidoreductase activity [Lecanosticta acicola]
MSSYRKGHTVEFHYDISCPFAYIASTKIEALAARTGANLVWKPVLLGAIYRATNAPQGAGGSASDVFNSTKKAITSQAFRRAIKRTGIPYNEPPRHPQKTTAPLRLLRFVHDDSRPALTKALYQAYWVDGKNVSDKTVLIDAVRRSGILDQEHAVRAIEDGSFEGQRQRRELEVSTDIAVQRGTPGVPAFWIAGEVWTDKHGDRRKGRLYWGQDRMHFVEAALMALNEGKDGDSLGSISRPLQSLVLRSTRRGIPEGQEVKLEFWYDFSSPWAFLGWTQLARLQRQFGERFLIEMKPFLLGILFREIGAPNLPTSTVSEQKRNYNALDHGDWVRWWNAVNLQDGKPDQDIAFYWADKFPIRTPTVLRAAIAEPRLVEVLYRACWERNLDMSSDEVLAKVIDEAGYNSKSILTRANSPEIKQDLRTRTAEAKEAGICGVPTYRVFRRKAGSSDVWQQVGDLVWGQDEVSVVEDVIAGWDGDGIATVDEEDKHRSKL